MRIPRPAGEEMLTKPGHTPWVNFGHVNLPLSEAICGSRYFRNFFIYCMIIQIPHCQTSHKSKTLYIRVHFLN